MILEFRGQIKFKIIQFYRKECFFSVPKRDPETVVSFTVMYFQSMEKNFNFSVQKANSMLKTTKFLIDSVV